MQLHYCRNLKISINTVNAKSTVGYLIYNSKRSIIFNRDEYNCIQDNSNTHRIFRTVLTALSRRRLVSLVLRMCFLLFFQE